MQRSVKPDEHYYIHVYRKQFSLFWAVVNMAGLILAPCILSLKWFSNDYVKITVYCFLVIFTINIIYHICVIFRYKKKPWEAGGHTFSRNHESKEADGGEVHKWTWIDIIDRQKLKEKYKATYTIKSFVNTSTSSDDEFVSFGSASEDSKIFVAYKYEVGVLITPSRLVIKSCMCPVPDWKCRLCPFRVYPIQYFKSWFWYPIEYAAEECLECGQSCFVTEDEYRQFQLTSYPLHVCDCKCKYCTFAQKRPLKPRINLLPDDGHCSCICHKCRIIEELIQGLEPHEEQEPPDEDLEISEAFGDFSEEEKYLQIWSPPQACNKRNPAAVLKNLIYQFSPPGESTYSSTGDSKSLLINNQIWKTFGINPFNLVTWTSNLRNWISNTIIKRIVEEMNRIDDNLISQGLTLVSIGHVGYDTLRATAFSDQIKKHVPTLLLLLPFLEISSNQQYIVQRIRELSVGNTMQDFAGQGGGKFNDIPWDAHLPSDAELIMHLMVTYFDAKLPPLINEPLRRPFSTQYFVKSPKLPPPHTELAIYQQEIIPPQYQLIVNDVFHQIPSGSNNVFYVLLLFIHCIKMKYDGMLGRINLGPAGLNMLWIVEDTTRI